MRLISVSIFLGVFAGAGLVAKRVSAQEKSVDAKPPVEITVRGRATEAQRLQRSAEAVAVVNVERAKKQTADLGEIMARTSGVAVLRAGGLGSDTRFSLNGLYDDQIRFFLDGVPLEVAGYPFGIANVPVNLIDRVEIYRGVVPIRFGADALGGAVQLVSDQRYDNGASVSYQVGSFGTYRLTLAGRYRHEPSGFVARANGFFDFARNNYDVDVEVAAPDGGSPSATVPRFHDRYAAYGTSLEVGFVERPWAKKLILRGYTTAYDKELQNNPIMTLPYGEVTYGERVTGATLRYEQRLLPNLDLDLIGNYAYRTIDFVDKSKWIYDWFGRRIGEHRVGGEGEIEDRPSDQTSRQHSGFARGLLAWTVAPAHALRFSTSPNYATRSGDERLQTDPTAPDPLGAKRELFTLVSGIEYEMNAIPMSGARQRPNADHRLQNIFFVKDYVYRADSDDLQSDRSLRAREQHAHNQGIGDSLRFRFTDWLYAKASYEYATRLPRPDEVFGNGVLIGPNLELLPEVSHNGNIGPRIELRRTTIGDVTVDINGFLRESDNLIQLFGGTKFFSYQNVVKARTLGVEGSFAWTLPRRWLTLDGSTTFQDVRNQSSDGPFAGYKGDRIPARPWLFASWGARLRFEQLLRADDQLEPFYVGRYVHEFFRAWESQGAREYKQTVDAQITHGVGVIYSLGTDFARISTTFEVQNLTDTRAYDSFGVQKPGRALFVKISGEL